MGEGLTSSAKASFVDNWIYLQQALGYASRRIKDIMKTYKTSQNFFSSPYEEWKDSGIFTKRDLLKLKNFDTDKIEKIKAHCKQKGYKIITYESPNYPNRLKNIYNPPAILYVNGTFPNVDNELCIAIVGTRSATRYGLGTSFEFGYKLAKFGATVVSGGALGIDSSAQKGAIMAGGKVISVMGCGLDCHYLEKNNNLKKAISLNGAIVSEYEPGYAVIARNFPVRNRIISALSLGTLIVEAGRKSGSLITANLALEQNRDLFAVPGDIKSSMSIGTNSLIKECAKPVTCVEDILEEYYSRFPNLNTTQADKGSKIEGKIEPIEKMSKRENKNLKVSSRARNIYNFLKNTEFMTIDELILKTKMSTADALQGITELELNGLVESKPGRMYKKK